MPSPSLQLSASQRAFPAHPRVDRYFAAASCEAARRRLTQCLLRGDGPALLLGAPGVGKTMLLEAIAADLADQLKVVRLASTQLCTRRALLQAVLHGLGASFRDREEGELRLSLNDALGDKKITGEGVALLVDEAQTLPVRLLEELRVLSNVAVEGTPRLRLVLAGSHALDEAFTAPELEAFSQRIAARCYLDPLSREETGRYVRAHIAAAGGDPDRMLAGDAYDALVRASDGLPRLVNQVADRALVMAVEAGRKVIDAAAISEAWSDLHQLAAPWQSPASSRLAASARPQEAVEPSSIEYGVLDDDEYKEDAYDKDVFDEALDTALQSKMDSIGAMQPLGNRGAAAGVWDAGDRLLELAGDIDGSGFSLDAGAAEEDEDDQPCVAYAFPGSTRSTDEEEDLLLQEADDLYEEVAAVAKPGKSIAKESSTDPFAEDFDEEEVVLDPYAELERVIPAAPKAIASQATDLGKAFAALSTAAEGFLDDSVVASPVAVIEQQPFSAEDDAILIVDQDDEPVPAAAKPAARREDYAQLFAQLRQG